MSNSLRMRDYETSCPGDINLYDEELARRADVRVSQRERERKAMRLAPIIEATDKIESDALEIHFDPDASLEYSDRIRSSVQALRRMLLSEVRV